MLIAISQRNDKNKFGDLSDNLESNYVNYLEKFGIELVVIPNTTEDISFYFDKLPIDGVILTGGNSVNPELYGGKLEEGSDASKERDETEKRLLEKAVEKKLPVLGICRGMQFINVFFKGKLVNVNNHVRVDHTIKITDEDAVKLLGEKAEVNSYHNYGVNDGVLSPELKVFAKASDGVVEGIYHPLLPIAGIEWHPERKSSNELINKKIVEAFVNRKLFWRK